MDDFWFAIGNVRITNERMSDPTIFQKSPIVQKAEPGFYWWCSCGRSATQPFCDGSHKGTEFTPIVRTSPPRQNACNRACARKRIPKTNRSATAAIAAYNKR